MAVLFNFGSRVLLPAPAAVTLEGEDLRDLEVGDLNGDGSLDAIVCGFAAGSLYVLWNSPASQPEVLGNGTPVLPVNAGAYAVTGVVNAVNWVATNTAVLTIRPADQAITSFVPPSGSYDNTNILSLSASGGGSGCAVVFTVTSGPGVIVGWESPAFRGTGRCGGHGFAGRQCQLERRSTCDAYVYGDACQQPGALCVANNAPRRIPVVLTVEAPRPVQSQAVGIAQCCMDPDAWFVLRWPSTFGRTYSVARTPDLGQEFQVLTNGLPATPPENTFRDNCNGIDRAFYRVTEE